MQTFVLTTDKGPHTAEDWAAVSSKQIFPIDDPITPLVGARKVAAMKLSADIATAMIAHHAAVQTAEQAGLADNAPATFASPPGAGHPLEQVTTDIQKAAEGTPWQAHFHDPDVIVAVQKVAGSHFTSVQHIERFWHADRNKTPEGLAYKALHHPATPAAA
jgi:PPE-repeat protein